MTRATVLILLWVCIGFTVQAQVSHPEASHPVPTTALGASNGSVQGGARNPGTPVPEIVVLPEMMPDPIEPVNRVMWGFNKGLMIGVIKPTSNVYRFVIVKPVRTGIANIGRNLTYPVLVINNLLQGRWRGARDETCRFVCNSTAGIAGFFDIATKWNIPRSDADFGQTFGRWGWKPGCYLMLPVYGPSDERDAVGLAGDTASNPLVYVSPYKFSADDPLTYFGPYSYFTYAVMYNNFADTVRENVRFIRAEMDPYSEIEYAWTFARKTRLPDLEVKGRQDEATLETLGSQSVSYKNPDFPGHGKTRSVLIPSTGRRLKFTYWLQPRTAPVVYLMPGLGSHRLTLSELALAEMVYRNGYSAVTISSAFHSEFMDNASTAALPAYLPVDGHDVQVALTEIDRYLHTHYPGRLGRKALMGYSMGALHTLYLAASTPTNQSPLVTFDRYLAIDTPVRLLHGVMQLDRLYRAPLEWPSAERTDDIENTLLKVAALSKIGPTPQRSLPFSAIESKFLIGLAFRLTLRDVIFASQRRVNLGVLRQPIRNFRREPVYQEILQYSFQDYFEKFAIPYYEERGMVAPAADVLEKAGDLRSYTGSLRANPNVRVIVNQNDFLLGSEDLAWLRSTFGERLTVFPHGGHLGNLGDPVVQQKMLAALAAL